MFPAEKQQKMILGFFFKIRRMKWDKKFKTHHHRIDFIVVAIHPIGGHGFSVFDANFGHFLSGAG